MDRKLKERVTGATLLVLIAIIVIPWVLDGEVTESTVETQIELPTPVTTVVISDRDELDRPVMPSLPQAPVATTTRTPPKPVTRLETAPTPAPEPATEPLPAPAKIAAVPAQTTTRTVPRPQPATSKPASEPTPVPETKPTVRTPQPAPEPARTTLPADPTSGWAVQVGSFSSQANADKLAARLVGLQYKAFVSRKSVNGRVWYRVRIGPRATRSQAVELSERLKRDSQAVAIVPHP